MVQKNNCNNGDVHPENPSKHLKPIKRNPNPSKTHPKPPKVLK
jgi:hypothetical protein